MSIGKKLRKLRQDPGLFVHDLVASRPGAPEWLVKRLEGLSVGLFIRWGREQSTVGPLVPRFRRRADRYGVAETVRVAERAIARARKAGEESTARMILAATACALADLDPESAARFAEPYVAVNPEVAEFVIDATWRQKAFDLGQRLIHHLDPSSEIRSEFSLARIKALAGTRLTEALTRGEEAIREAVGELIVEGDELFTALTVSFGAIHRHFVATKEYPRLVAELGEALLDDCEGQPADSLNIIAARTSDALIYEGHIGQAVKVLERHEDLDVADPVIGNRLARARSLAGLLDESFDYLPPAPAEPYVSLPGQVLFVLHHSAPFHSNGYATRGHGLLTALKDSSWDVTAVTRMGYPGDLHAFAGIEVDPSSVVDGVEYLRIPGRGHNLTPLRDYLEQYTDALLRVVLKREPAILHAHSNALNGVVANSVGRTVGIPTIYEVRGLWELTRASRQGGFDQTEHYKMLRQMEIDAARGADAVICITRALADEMVRCGVDRDKISVVPNGVDVDRFTPRSRDDALAAELGLEGKKVIGYVGSLVDYEGLDDLLRAIRILADRGRDDIAALIVGDGMCFDPLREQADELGLGELITFTGRVPHAEVERYYSLIDIAPFPRKSLPVTEMVSPLKPFEAMAMDKVVVGSDVAALVEIIDDGVNGYLFEKDSPEALADTLERALGATDLAAREWVCEHRSWSRIIEGLQEVYTRLAPRRHQVPLVDLSDIDVSGSVAEIKDRYESSEINGHSLRLDDYTRLSHILTNLEPGASILDVGIGAGQFLNAVATDGRFAELRGVDIQRHPSFQVFGEPFPVDYHSVESLPYADDQFDVVTCLEVIEHLSDEIFEPSIAELRRVCRGRLVITVPFRERVLSEDHKRRFDLDDLERLFPEADVTILRKTNSQLGRPTYWAMIEERK